MSALSIQPTFPIFTETDGQPLENGYIWLGTVNLDPQVNPVNVYFDAALTIQAAQPIRTINGYPSRNGTPARLYVNSDYSIRVMNKNGSMVYSAPAATERYSADLVSITGFKGQVGTVQDLAGNDGADWIGFEQAGGTAVPRSAQDKMREIISVVDYGAIGDDATICTAEIQAALDAASTDGAIVLFPPGVFLIDDVLIVKSNTTIIMNGTVKVDAMPVGGYETVFVTDPVNPADNIQFINPQIDANNVVPTSGIMLRYGATNVRVYGGHIRNCANDALTPGGRGFNIEGGVDQQNLTISGTNITGCWNGVSFAGGAAQANSNVSISNLTISDCQIAVSLFGNTSGYPHTGEFMQAVFSSLAIRNCGHLTTFTTQAGVIVSDRGSNVSFSDVYVFNDSTYGAVGALFRGDANNISMSNVTMDGDLTEALFNFSSYAESNSYPLSANSSLDSRFMNVKHNGTIPEIVLLPVVSASYLTNCQFDVLTDVVTSDSPININLANKTDVYIKAQNKTSNAILQGYCADIYAFSNLFSDWTDQEQNFSLSGASKAFALIDGTTGAVVRSFGILCTRNSAGDYSISLTRPLPTVGYTLLIDATPTNNTAVQSYEVTAKTGLGFRLFTYSANVLTDKALINIAIFY